MASIYIVSLPNGREASRCSKRAYTHAVVVVYTAAYLAAQVRRAEKALAARQTELAALEASITSEHLASAAAVRRTHEAAAQRGYDPDQAAWAVQKAEERAYWAHPVVLADFKRQDVAAASALVQRSREDARVQEGMAHVYRWSQSSTNAERGAHEARARNEGAHVYVTAEIHVKGSKATDPRSNLCRRCQLPRQISGDHEPRCTWNPRNRRSIP